MKYENFAVIAIITAGAHNVELSLCTKTQIHFNFFKNNASYIAFAVMMSDSTIFAIAFEIAHLFIQ